MPTPRLRHAARAIACAAATAAVLAACAHPLVVDAAPYAGDPECARVMIAMPTTVGGLDRTGTTSQATEAWGREYGIVARCGVEPLGPTADPCITVTGLSGTVDWVLVEGDDAWVAVTYGRSPALEVTIPTVRADQAVVELLGELTPAAALAPTNGRSCLGASDVG